ncbi:MAG TPA: hypothetical protein DIU15_09225, partial [Deltaproteobacteria bacterium]|nr:hypothetical protein [Deltaproteobacteria bacterium]
NTQLTEAAVDAFVANNGYLTAGGSPGTVMYTRCAWTGINSQSVGACVPPPCPSDWSDLGVTGNVKAVVAGWENHSSTNHSTEAGGYQERGCYSTTPMTVLVTRCAWTGNNAEVIGACVPPPCPSDWSDLGVTGNVKAAAVGWENHSSTNHSTEAGGYQERTCAL